jgi:hypothetical protein
MAACARFEIAARAGFSRSANVNLDRAANFVGQMSHEFGIGFTIRSAQLVIDMADDDWPNADFMERQRQPHAIRTARNRDDNTGSHEIHSFASIPNCGNQILGIAQHGSTISVD